MTRSVLAIGMVALARAAMAGTYADSAYVAPVSAKALQETLHAIPQDEVAAMLSRPMPHHVYDLYEGQNAALAASAEGTQPLSVGVGFPTDMSASALFASPGVSEDGSAVQYLAAITSVDAVALRLEVDLAGLTADQEVYVIDPLGPRAMGPYTAGDMVGEGRWLPTVEGDTAVLLARAPEGAPPALRLVGVSHFYRRIEDVKELSCNINAACLTDPALVEASSGVGIMVRTGITGNSALCSGTLINNSDTVENEPLYITANHCIPGAIGAQQADIVWDFRTDNCGDFIPPLLSTLPRSDVAELLETDATLDITLLRLESVPGGEFGRAYVGWDTRVPGIGDDVVGIHHPDGAYMRVSFGDVTAINQPGFGTLPYIKQTEVKWSDGVTEGGSSGSCLLFESDARLLGTLSNGPTHSCVDTSGNKDRYASFRDFFPQIEEYLTNGGGNGPTIEVSESVHSFGTTHESWTLAISNGDDASTLTFTIAAIPAWLDPSRTSGQSTGPNDVEEITFTVVPEMLSPGLNTASMQITAVAASPRTIVVSAWGAKTVGCSGARPGGGLAVVSDVLLLVATLLAMGVLYRRARA